MNTDTGIYRITSPSGNFYIGSASSFKKRWAKHLHLLRNGKHHSKALQSAYDKYNGDLEFSVVVCCSIPDLIVVEQRYIDALNPRYNVCNIAGSMLGYRHTPEAIAKTSAAIRGDRHYLFGKKPSEETRSRISEANRGQKRSQEFCKRNGDVHRGKVIPAEVRAKISESLRGEKNANFGKSRAKEMQERLLAGIRKPVVCVETGAVFESGRAATDWLRSNGHPTARNSHISSTCNGKLKRAYGYAWRFA